MTSDIRLKQDSIEVHAQSVEIRRSAQESPMAEIRDGTVLVGGAGMNGAVSVRGGGGAVRVRIVSETSDTVHGALVTIDGEAGTVAGREHRAAQYVVFAVLDDTQVGARGLIGFDERRVAMTGRAEIRSDRDALIRPQPGDELRDRTPGHPSDANPGSFSPTQPILDPTAGIRDGRTLTPNEYIYTLHVGRDFDVVAVKDLKLGDDVESLVAEIKRLRDRLDALERA